MDPILSILANFGSLTGLRRQFNDLFQEIDLLVWLWRIVRYWFCAVFQVWQILDINDSKTIDYQEVWAISAHRMIKVDFLIVQLNSFFPFQPLYATFPTASSDIFWFWDTQLSEGLKKINLKKLIHFTPEDFEEFTDGMWVFWGLKW